MLLVTRTSPYFRCHWCSSMKVAYLDVGGCAQRDAAAVARDIARESGSEVTWIGFDDGPLHGSIQPRLVHLGGEATPPFERSSRLGGYDVVVAPAATDSSSGYIERELWAGLLAHSRRLPVLRVRRRPPAINHVLMLVDSTPACRTLARRFVQIGIWSEARILVLPMDSPSVGLFLEDAVETLRTGGNSVTVLPALELTFEQPELECLLGRVQAAVMAHLSHRVGLSFGAVRNDPFAIVADRAPLVLLP